MPHELEEKLRAPANDIFDAILRGFRAQVDVKGKLAELYLGREIERLKSDRKIEDFVWNDKDGKPDFHVSVDGFQVKVECKNVRVGKGKAGSDWATVELQKTRSGKDANGKQTRGYPVEHFDIVAACLFNVTNRWEFRFARSENLVRRAADSGILEVMQKVTFADGDRWTSSLVDVFTKEVSARRGKLPT